MTTQNAFRRNRLAGFSPISALKEALGGCLSYLQHVLMKAAVAVSLQLCLFAARILLNSGESAREQTGQSL